jgi:hypothetical protein
MERDDRFEKALHSANPSESLRGLVHELATEGFRKQQIVEAFEQQLNQLETEPAREPEADAIRDVLDFLVGWCSPHMKLLREDSDISSTPPR